MKHPPFIFQANAISYPQSEQQARNKIMKRSCVAERERAREREREGRERKREGYPKGLGYVMWSPFCLNSVGQVGRLGLQVRVDVVTAVLSPNSAG